ncbi:MAG: beta-galactosidase [Oscillospiraceae bacterium]|nr:beta-galactosidase [Oscillospiraceae bacterium]
MKRFLALALCALLVFGCSIVPVTAAATQLSDFDQTYFDGLAAKEQELKEKLDACALAGIPTDYETVNYTTFRTYRASMWTYLYDYARHNLLQFTLEEALYYDRCLRDIYDEAVSSLDALLSGEKTGEWVPRYVTGPTRIDGQSVRGTARAGDITEEDRPIFFIGFGGWSEGYESSRQIHGLNAFGMDSSMNWGYIDPPQEGDSADYRVNYKTESDYWASRAEEDNFYYATMVSPHHMPPFLLEKYPEIVVDSGPHAFIPFDISHPYPLKVLTDFMEARLPQFIGSQSLKSITLTNEPVFHSWKSENHLAPWREFLRERYGNDIAKLNGNCRTRYKSFGEVPFPAMKASALMVDFIDYNDMVMDDFNMVMVDKIREELGDIPIDIKLMDYYSTGKWKSSYDERVFLRGADHEKLAGYTQINGCDAWRNLDREFQNPLDQAFDPVKYNSKSMWYDLLRSANNAPVFNSEDHLTIDDDERMIPEFKPFLISDLWMGAVHGRTVSTAWIWQSGNPGSMFYHSLGWRPDLVTAMARTCLDLNRLAYEVTALQNAPADVAVLYSKSSHIFDYRNVTETMYDAYQYATLSGQRVDFVTERDIAEKLGNYKMLILPKTSRLPKASLEAIMAFQKNGGSVVIIGLDSLLFDEYGHMRNPLDILSIYSNASKIMPSLNIFGISLAFIKRVQQRAFQKALVKEGLYNVALTDTKTGRPVAETEWFETEYDGKTIINMCSFTWGVDRTVNISIDGNKCSEMIDLITGERFNGTVTLEPFMPRLIQVG